MLEKTTRPRDVRRWPGAIPVRHRYTPGVAGEVFFTALRDEGVLLGSRCGRCDLVYAPARSFCERCFSGLVPDTEVGPGGELVSFTIAFVDVDGASLEEPIVYGLVRRSCIACSTPGRSRSRSASTSRSCCAPRPSAPARSWTSRASARSRASPGEHRAEVQRTPRSRPRGRAARRRAAPRARSCGCRRHPGARHPPVPVRRAFIDRRSSPRGSAHVVRRVHTLPFPAPRDPVVR